jgi:hypothetical protein
MAEPAEAIPSGKQETTLLVLFIPSADRAGGGLGNKEQKRWVRKAMKLLGKKFHGATAFPRGWGVWRDDAQGGSLVWDRPVLIQCFTSEDALRQHSGALREFLVDLGTRTNQGAVGLVIDRTYYEIEFPLQGE